MDQFPTPISIENQHIEAALQSIFSSAPIRIESATGGTFTPVYRIVYPNETFYLRVLPGMDISYSSEFVAHTHLRAMQVKVPDVIHFEHYNEILQGSCLVTTQIKGKSLDHSPDLSQRELEAILIEAGRDLAHINTLPVAGFGWMHGSDNVDHLCAPLPTYRAYMLEDWQQHINHLAEHFLSPTEIGMVERLLTRYNSWLHSEHSYLAHGDFSSRHIFQEHGRYTGIIDFGDIEGGCRWHDLGHFHMRDAESLPYRFETDLVRGYQEVTKLPTDYEQHIRFISVLLNIRILAYLLSISYDNHQNQHLLNRLREDLTALS